MRFVFRYVLPLVALGAVPVLAIAFPGCSGQGEGERCDRQADDNGKGDCAGDLVCVKHEDLNGASTDRCCPADRSRATTPVCQLATAGGLDAAPPPVDAAPDAQSDAPVADGPVDSAATDAPIDAPVDAGQDAPADAPEDG
jgi:hypothetical protein